VPVDNVPVNVKPAIVVVPVNVGPAVSALVAIAVAMLTNSVLNSVPLMILFASPEDRESLEAKSVVFV
jgi:hypothetical protein